MQLMCEENCQLMVIFSKFPPSCRYEQYKSLYRVFKRDLHSPKKFGSNLWWAEEYNTIKISSNVYISAKC